VEQGETEDQAHCPHEKEQQKRERPVNAEKCFPAFSGLHPPGHSRPGNPGAAIEKPRQPYAARDPSGQNDSFEPVPQDNP
jgi:hypothetical protein